MNDQPEDHDRARGPADGASGRSSATPECLRLLGLGPGCTLKQVKQAFRARVRLVHPDAGGSQEEFVRLHEAYEEAVFHVGHGHASDGPRSSAGRPGPAAAQTARGPGPSPPRPSQAESAGPAEGARAYSRRYGPIADPWRPSSRRNTKATWVVILLIFVIARVGSYMRSDYRRTLDRDYFHVYPPSAESPFAGGSGAGGGSVDKDDTDSLLRLIERVNRRSARMAARPYGTSQPTVDPRPAGPTSGPARTDGPAPPTTGRAPAPSWLEFPSPGPTDRPRPVPYGRLPPDPCEPESTGR